MKLSMWMLADRLSKYHPRPEIKNGAETIAGLRFITGESTEFSPEYLYVGRACDVFSDERYLHAMIIVNAYDFILFDNITHENLLNEILLTFDFYNSWESRLLEASFLEEPLQNMLAASADIFKSPAIILNNEGHVTAYSKNYNRDAFNDFWRELTDTNTVPTSHFGTRIITHDGQVLSEWTETPQVYAGSGQHPDYIAANLVIDGEFVGALLLLGFEEKFGPQHCQLAGRLCLAAVQTAAGKGRTFELPSNSMILQRLLEGTPPTPLQIQQLSEKWSAPWVLFAVKSISGEPTKLRKNTTLNKIRSARVRSLSLLYGHEILAVTDRDNADAFLQESYQIINPESFQIGISLPFSKWENFKERYHQALFVLEKNAAHPGIFYCRDYAFEYMTAAYKNLNCELLMLHPAPELLWEYDKLHNTEFYRTLYVYLANDRNVVNTSGILHVHRNTLLYRIKKLTEIIHTSLEDSDERVYILLSYKINSFAPIP